jgi:hypothetical protein
MGPLKLTSGASALLQKAINNFKAINGRVPSAQEMAQIEQQANRFSMPTSGLRSGPSASPRASYELGTDLNLINPDTARDPFLTKMTTGRTTKGTNLRPIAQDVSDPSVVKNIEAQQMSGQLDELMPGASQGSTTPSSDYFANQSAAIEDAALQGNALDVLKNAFIQKNKRQPSETELKDIVSQFDEDELNAIVAQYNPARHQYGSQGVGIMSQRPPSAKGMTDFRNAARNEGVEESYLTKRQGNYPQYIQDELAIQRGELPAIALKEKKKRYKDVQPVDFYIDENGNPVKIYPTMKAEGGQITPRDMLAQMMVNQVTPQKFKSGNSVMSNAKNAYNKMSGFNKLMAAVGPADVAYELSQKRPGGAALSAFDTITGATMPALRGFIPLQAAMYSSDLGDATLDTYRAKKEAEAQAYRDHLRRTSPVFLKDEEPQGRRIEDLNELGF